MTLRTLHLTDLTIDDEKSFRHVALYGDLKEALTRDAVPFRVPAPGARAAAWDRVLFLNLTFWGAGDSADVLVDDHIPADVVMHVAWHHLAKKALGDASGSAAGLFLGESIASAFDLYLVGRLLGHSPNAEFLETQVPALAAAAEASGLPARRFEALLAETTEDPERAFGDLRELLFDATTSLVLASSVDDATDRLTSFDGHRFAPFLHHYEISNWILFARAYASKTPGADQKVVEIDRMVRASGAFISGVRALFMGQVEGTARSKENSVQAPSSLATDSRPPCRKIMP